MNEKELNKIFQFDNDKYAMICTLVISNIFILILKNNKTNIWIFKVTKF